jgi:hypothetical protein
MENSGVLRTRRLRLKPTHIGAIATACCTLSIIVIAKLCGGGESGIGYALILPYILSIFPLASSYKLLGMTWRAGSVQDLTFMHIVLAIAINALLGALMGYIVGTIIRFAKGALPKQQSK